LVITVLVAFAFYVLPTHGFAEGSISAGKKTADEAATWHSDEAGDSDIVKPLKYAVPMAGGYAQADTTESEFEFPDEENKHLIRDITIFLIASVFVAYFVIKVFLEGDKDDEGTDDENNRPPPPL